MSKNKSNGKRSNILKSSSLPQLNSCILKQWVYPYNECYLPIKSSIRNSLAFQWLGHRAFIEEGPGSNPGQGTKIPKVAWYGKK